MTDKATKISKRPKIMLITSTIFGKRDKSDNIEGSKPRTEIIGPVVVRQATAITTASSNNKPNIARIIVTEAKLTMNSIKKIHAIKTEILRLLSLTFVTGIEEG